MFSILQSYSNLMLTIYFCNIIYIRFGNHWKTVDYFCTIIEKKLIELALQSIIIMIDSFNFYFLPNCMNDIITVAPSNPLLNIPFNRDKNVLIDAGNRLMSRESRQNIEWCTSRVETPLGKWKSPWLAFITLFQCRYEINIKSTRNQ